MMKLPCLNDQEWAKQVEVHLREMDEFKRRIKEILSINDSTVGELQNFAVKVAEMLKSDGR